MFTGLVQGTGKLVGKTAEQLTVLPDFRRNDWRHGESIAVNGCCLTLERVTDRGEWVFHTLQETLRRTNFGALNLGSPVNYERALRLGDALGGHLVQGHVDQVLRVLDSGDTGHGDHFLEVELPAADAALVVTKGSIALDGVSLTVAEAGQNSFRVCVIPVTWMETALRFRSPGSLVNVEYDLIGRYMLRRAELTMPASGSGITMEKLREAGFC